MLKSALLLLALVLVLPVAAYGQDVATLSAALAADQKAHLWRVGVWGTTNLVGGLTLLATNKKADRPAWYGLGWQSAAWGAINLTIATVGLLSGPADISANWAEAFRAENTYADILLVNLGLNVAYSSVGATMVILSYRDVRSARLLRGHGSALILQGLGLFALDGIAYLATRSRLDALVDLAGRTKLAVHPEGLSLMIGL